MRREKRPNVLPRTMDAIFKGLAKALDQATTVEDRLAGKVLSTKGLL